MFLILQLYFHLFIYSDDVDTDENILTKHKLLDPTCIFLGFLLNIIPEWISNMRSRSTNPINLSIIDMIKLFFISLFLLIIHFLRIFPTIIKKNNKYEYEDYFNIFDFLIIYLVPHSSEVYYRHQKFSFLIFTLIEIIKIIVFLIDKTFDNYLAISIEIIISIYYAFYFIYIKGLMKYKFISPYKCNFLIGIIDFPLIIIIYLIISFSSLGNEKND